MAAVASEVSILERARPALAAGVDELRNKISAVEQRVTAARQALELIASAAWVVVPAPNQTRQLLAAVGCPLERP